MFKPDEIETAACPICNSNDFQVAYDRFKPYLVVQCQSCSVYYLSPRPIEEAARKHYMSDDYFTDNKFGYSDYQSQEKTLRATFRRFLHNLKKASLDGEEVWLLKWILLTPAVWPAIGGPGMTPHPGGWLPNWISAQSGETLLREGDTSREAGEPRAPGRE